MCWVYTAVFLSLAASALAQDCTCRPKSRCAWALASKAQAAVFVCDLPGGGEGFCCSDVLSRPKDVRQSILSFSSFKRRTRSTTTVNPTLFTTQDVSLTSSSTPPTRVPDKDTKRKPSLTSSTIVPRIAGRNFEGLDGTASSELGGYRLYKKSKKEFQALGDYARKLLHFEA
jgi:hypothetical protein